jgi:hypothetical protein
MRPPVYVLFWQGRERIPGRRGACRRPYRIDIIGRGDPERRAEFQESDRAAAVAYAVRIAREEALPISLYNADISEAEAPGIRLLHPSPFRSPWQRRPARATGADSPGSCPCSVMDGAGIYCRAAHRRTCPAVHEGGACLLAHPAGPWRSVSLQIFAIARPVDAWALLDAAGGA